MRQNMTEEIERQCADCGKTIPVIVHDDGSYTGGHYFGDLLGEESDEEYWECDECYKTGDVDHEKLVEQAETVLETTRASMYEVADGEAQRLQNMFDEVLEDD